MRCGAVFFCRENGPARIEIGISYLRAWTRLYRSQMSRGLAACAALQITRDTGIRFIGPWALRTMGSVPSLDVALAGLSG